MKAVVSTFNQQKALVGALSVIVETLCAPTTDLFDAAGDGCEGGGAHDHPALVAGPLAEVQVGGGPQLQEGRGRGGGAGPALASARPLAASSLGRGPAAGVHWLLLHQSQMSIEMISTNESSPAAAAAAGGLVR